MLSGFEIGHGLYVERLASVAIVSGSDSSVSDRSFQTKEI